MSVLSSPKGTFWILLEIYKKPIKMLFSSTGLGMASESYFLESGGGLDGTERRSLA